METDSFDKDVQILGTLMRHKGTLDAFNALYEKLLGRVLMMKLIDLRGIASGVYRVRLMTLQALMHDQMAWAKSIRPAEMADADQEVRRARDSRDRRERLGWN